MWRRSCSWHRAALIDFDEVGGLVGEAAAVSGGEDSSGGGHNSVAQDQFVPVQHGQWL
jgi:hypothetical protein